MHKGKDFSLLLFLHVSLGDIQSGPSSLSSALINFSWNTVLCLDTVLGGKDETTGKTKGEQQLGRSRKRIELQGKVEWIIVTQTEGEEPKVGMMTIS